jgi:Rad3-related DNA helicase
MSATICGIEEYARALGIANGDYKAIQIDNPIPVENRLIHVVPVAKMTGGLDEDKLNTLVRNIDNIIDSHVGENGIIHTVSYALAEKIFERSRHKKKMLVSGKVRDIMDALDSGGGQRVILSPSIEEGVDLKGNLSRFQIIAKVPYGYLGDPLVKLRSERYPSSYARTTILRIVQACGRSVRGIDDWAHTYILDSAFDNLLTRNAELFPEWFKEALQFHDV